MEETNKHPNLELEYTQINYKRERIMLDLKSLFDLADKLGVIQIVRDKLLRQPDGAIV